LHYGIGSFSAAHLHVFRATFLIARAGLAEFAVLVATPTLDAVL